MKSEYKKKVEEMQLIADVILDSESDDLGHSKGGDVVMKGASHNVFCDSVRITFMALEGEAGVSASKCSKVVNLVSKHLYQKEIHYKSYHQSKLH